MRLPGRAWLQFEMPARREVEWRFMDGPYVATLTKATGAALRSPERGFHASGLLDLWDDVHAIRCPTLIIKGGELYREAHGG